MVSTTAVRGGGSQRTGLLTATPDATYNQPITTSSTIFVAWGHFLPANGVQKDLNPDEEARTGEARRSLKYRLGL